MGAATARAAIHDPDVLFIGAQVAPIPHQRLRFTKFKTRENCASAHTPASVQVFPGATNPPGVPSQPSHAVVDAPPQRPPRPVSAPHPEPVPPMLREEEVEAIMLPAPELRLDTKPALAALEPPQEDDAELAELRAVLAMSQAETIREEKLKEKMLSQEEADLARALEASMSMTSWHNNSYSSGAGEHSTTAAGSSSLPTVETDFTQLDYMDDAAFARLLAAEEQESTPTQTSFQPSTVINTIPPPPKTDAPDKSPPLNPPTSDDGNLPIYSPRRPPATLPGENGASALSADEEFARQLALEEEVLARESKDKPQDSSSESPYLESKSLPSVDTNTVLVADPPRMKFGGTELTWADSSLESPVMLIEAGRSASVDATNFRSPSELLYPPDSIQPLISSASSYNEDSDVRSAYQLLDADLGRGVSIGFVAPTITPELVPMHGPMPNRISLPYGRCPPLHLQAPTWRHLLKLMARLSGTRIEPTVEALAVTRSSQMQLRTIVQFVRTHHASPDWRTVLWFTIDHPVPPHLPNSRKFTNGDVDVLPWSYTLSSLPALLRDGSDTPLSKFYTIPSSAAVPFPSLPISFPNMAMYLQAALEESRKYMGDSSSGMRKLAKMVETCYPQMTEPGEDDGERSRVGGLFKKVIGRGGRKDRSKKGGGNLDTYELVTPFVLDDWGQ
ncbi:hypothetical protein B0H12DRAFT_1085921 [Mycena haematopus]|nr:hypothetical protein B0H12DRAFT_1085921 [Mycena haematopus]